MPAKSAKQERFMRAVAHDPKFAAKVGVPQPVGLEYSAAPPSAPAPRITTPGGAVSSGGFLEGTQFKRMPMRPRKAGM